MNNTDREAQGAALFDLGATLATPGALPLLAETGGDSRQLLRRHVTGDGGDLPPEDAESNRLAIASGGGMVMSVYPLPGGAHVIWIITSQSNIPGETHTTLLLPSEY